MSAHVEASWLITCEHGGNRVPAAFAALFAGQRALLRTHRGYDIGALPFARRLARAKQAPLFAATVTRLLVDLNRSLHHAKLFSPRVAELPAHQRERVLARYYHPHRDEVEAFIRRCRRPVVHIGVHSFTPVLDGKIRATDVGLLYDPRRAPERAWSRRFKKVFIEQQVPWRLRFNYPYEGAADGFTTHLRRLFDADRYIGIELEVNQGTIANAAARENLTRSLLETFRHMPP